MFGNIQFFFIFFYLTRKLFGQQLCWNQSKEQRENLRLNLGKSSRLEFVESLKSIVETIKK